MAAVQPRLTQAHRLSAHLARQAGGLRTAGSAHRRQHASARGARGHLSGFSGQDWCTPCPPSQLDTAWWVVTACRRGSPAFTAATAARPSSGFGEIPAQQCGGLQVADLAERSGVP